MLREDRTLSHIVALAALGAFLAVMLGILTVQADAKDYGINLPSEGQTVGEEEETDELEAVLDGEQPDVHKHVQRPNKPIVPDKAGPPEEKQADDGKHDPQKTDEPPTVGEADKTTGDDGQTGEATPAQPEPANFHKPLLAREPGGKPEALPGSETDPFGDLGNPFGGMNDPFGNPFGGMDDPFGLEDDLFGGPPAGVGDPFGPNGIDDGFGFPGLPGFQGLPGEDGGLPGIFGGMPIVNDYRGQCSDDFDSCMDMLGQLRTTCPGHPAATDPFNNATVGCGWGGWGGNSHQAEFYQDSGEKHTFLFNTDDGWCYHANGPSLPGEPGFGGPNRVNGVAEDAGHFFVNEGKVEGCPTDGDACPTSLTGQVEEGDYFTVQEGTVTGCGGGTCPIIPGGDDGEDGSDGQDDSGDDNTGEAGSGNAVNNGDFDNDKDKKEGGGDSGDKDKKNEKNGDSEDDNSSDDSTTPPGEDSSIGSSGGGDNDDDDDEDDDGGDDSDSDSGDGDCAGPDDPGSGRGPAVVGGNPDDVNWVKAAGGGVKDPTPDGQGGGVGPRVIGGGDYKNPRDVLIDHGVEHGPANAPDPSAVRGPGFEQVTDPAEPEERNGPFAEVLAVKGTAEKMVVEDGKAAWVALEAGDKLGELSVVRTGMRSAVELAFGDGSTAHLGGATKMGISKLPAGGANGAAAQLALKYGTVDVDQGPDQASAPVEVHTPAGAMTLASQQGGAAYAYGSGLRLNGGPDAWQLARGNQGPAVATAAPGAGPIMIGNVGAGAPTGMHHAPGVNTPGPMHAGAAQVRGQIKNRPLTVQGH